MGALKFCLKVGTPKNLEAYRTGIAAIFRGVENHTMTQACRVYQERV